MMKRMSNRGGMGGGIPGFGGPAMGGGKKKGKNKKKGGKSGNPMKREARRRHCAIKAGRQVLRFDRRFRLRQEATEPGPARGLGR